MPMSIVVVSELATASAAIVTRATLLLAEPSVLAKSIVAILKMICELAGESVSVVRAQLAGFSWCYLMCSNYLKSLFIKLYGLAQALYSDFFFLCRCFTIFESLFECLAISKPSSL